MKVNSFLINLAMLMIVIFGGTFILRYVTKGELLLDQMIGVFVGSILLIASFAFKKIKKSI
ncbi:hypothetical protein ACFDTO_32815 [Microbacteriaceae bacterium 4G12]